MDSQSPTPSSGTDRAVRDAVTRPGAVPYMSERQLQAYLLARDAVRRVRHTSSLVGATAQRSASDPHGAQGGCRQGH
jgi:hypothetical protein